MGRLDGKIVLVTGGNSGIGGAAAILFAREGAKVVIAARRVEQGRAVAAAIKDEGGEATFISADVTRTEDCRAMVQCALTRYGALNAAFNNAGYPAFGDAPTGWLLADTTDDHFDKTMAVNLRGTFNCMKVQIPALLAAGGGAIVNTASAGGLVGMSTMAAYVASKHGVVGLTRAAALDYAKYNIRINALCPGGVKTPMLEAGITDALEQQYIAAHPIGRLAVPMELARAALFLISDESSFVTGQAVAADGGLTVP